MENNETSEPDDLKHRKSSREDRGDDCQRELDCNTFICDTVFYFNKKNKSLL